jgi:PAS domain S-box-containing protein
VFSDLQTIGAVIAVLAIGALELLRARMSQRTAVVEAQLSAVVTACTDGVLWIDAPGRVASCNQAAAQIFGCTMNELVGRRIHSVIPSLSLENRKRKFSDCLRRATILDQPERMEAFGIDQDGNPFPISLVIKHAKAGGASQHVVVVRDDTRRNLA